MTKATCLRGHPTPPGSRRRSGNCRTCDRIWKKAHRKTRVDRTTPLSFVLGDYFRVEAEYGLLDAPHAYDPNRLTATPPWGFGWPDEEFLVLFVGRLLGARLKRGRGSQVFHNP